MENIEAQLISDEDECFIQIKLEPEIRIPISEDNAKAVKSAFNGLIRRLISGMFKITLKDPETEKDLFYHVAVEYLNQLNGELAEVYEEMEQNGFLDNEEEKS